MAATSRPRGLPRAPWPRCQDRGGLQTPLRRPARRHCGVPALLDQCETAVLRAAALPSVVRAATTSVFAAGNSYVFLNDWFQQATHGADKRVPLRLFGGELLAALCRD